jgi:hypothetical protein
MELFAFTVQHPHGNTHLFAGRNTTQHHTHLLFCFRHCVWSPRLVSDVKSTVERLVMER